MHIPIPHKKHISNLCRCPKSSCIRMAMHPADIITPPAPVQRSASESCHARQRHVHGAPTQGTSFAIPCSYDAKMPAHLPPRCKPQHLIPICAAFHHLVNPSLPCRREPPVPPCQGFKVRSNRQSCSFLLQLLVLTLTCSRRLQLSLPCDFRVARLEVPRHIYGGLDVAAPHAISLA